MGGGGGGKTPWKSPLQVGEWVQEDREGYLRHPGSACTGNKASLCAFMPAPRPETSAEVEKEEWAGRCQRVYWHACRVTGGRRDMACWRGILSACRHREWLEESGAGTGVADWNRENWIAEFSLLWQHIHRILRFSNRAHGAIQCSWTQYDDLQYGSSR